eukprot:516375-Amphidinium_carterae.1
MRDAWAPECSQSSSSHQLTATGNINYPTTRTPSWGSCRHELTSVCVCACTSRAVARPSNVCAHSATESQ